MTSTTSNLPTALVAATEHQPGVRAALAAALASPSHAYLLVGPPGSGKRTAAHAFAAELIAAGAPDPDDARRRALAHPSPHPDLVWLTPPGAQHLVEDVRERVIATAAYRPFEGEHRVFVIEAAEAMADESQNALLKTLEEPPSFVHILLVSSEPAMLLDTVRSRCQEVRFAPLPEEAVAERLGERGVGADDVERTAAARLSGGDVEMAATLASEPGRQLRDLAQGCAAAALEGEFATAPWRDLLALADAQGEEAAAQARERIEAEQEEQAAPGRRAGRRSRDADDAARRAGRRARTEMLDLGLSLIAAWLRDLAAVAEGAPELALNADRGEALARAAEGLDPRRARRGAELAMDTRRRLQVNVSEELALEALVFSLEPALSGS